VYNVYIMYLLNFRCDWIGLVRFVVVRDQWKFFIWKPKPRSYTVWRFKQLAIFFWDIWRIINLINRIGHSVEIDLDF